MKALQRLGPGDSDFNAAAAGQQLFGSASLGIWLADFGNTDQPISGGDDPEGGGRRWNVTAVFQESNKRFADKPLGSRSAWQAVSERAASMSDQLAQILAQHDQSQGDELVARECRFAAEHVQYLAERCVARWNDHAGEASAYKKYRARACELIGTYRSLWLERSRYGGLEDSCIWWRRLVE
ncbi:MAG: hypothetical protein PF961_10930 [Planctomycetota bacterium]|nr:hypothetical protein [Planctomycetota bacterium]